jgi:hypothetical protein
MAPAVVGGEQPSPLRAHRIGVAPVAFAFLLDEPLVGAEEGPRVACR